MLLIVLALYLNSFPAQFHYDDYALMLSSSIVTGKDFPYSAFLEQFGGRPLTLWTFHLNYRLGREDPFFYHLLNVLLHGLAAVLLYLLSRQWLPRSRLAFAAAVLFAAHPIQSQAVNYIWSRSMILMACFSLAALLLLSRRPVAALICFQLAIWSRADALVLTPILLYLRPACWRWVLTLGLGNLSGLLWSWLSYTPSDPGWSLAHDAPSYWQQQPVVLLSYLRLMILPVGLTIDHDTSSLSPFTNLGPLSLLVLGLVILFRMRQSYPIPAASLLWCFLWLLPTAAIPNPDLLNESRAYLALAGMALFLGWVLLETRFTRQLGLWVPLVLLVATYAMGTVQRNRIWKSDLALWQDASQKSPGKFRPQYNLGVALAQLGRAEQAEQALERALSLQPNHPGTLAALGYCAEVRGETRKAVDLYRAALEIEPSQPYALSRLRQLQGKVPESTSGQAAGRDPEVETAKELQAPTAPIAKRQN